MNQGIFEPGSMIRRVYGERALLLGGPRAVLMQLAHPLVARGVAEHSGFEADPFARLVRTLDTMYTIVFGTAEEARAAAAGLRAVHDRVTGVGYQANDAELLLWVHATLTDTGLRTYNRFVGRLTPDEAEDFYAATVVLGEILGVPTAVQPRDLAGFRTYVRGMVATLEVSHEARVIARSVLHPPVPWVAEPIFTLAREVTAGLLPRPLREQFGFGWDRQRKAALVAAGVAARQVMPLVPGLVRRVA